MNCMKKNGKMIFILFGIIILTFSLHMFLFYQKNEIVEELEVMDVSFENREYALEKVNYDNTIPVGWIQVQGTNIDLPVLIVGLDANLPVTIDYSWQSINYNTGENREVIISHNLLNLSNHPSRNMSELSYFEGLMAFVYYDFAQENLYIQYTKNGVSELYVIYAIGFYDNEYDLGQSFSNNNNVENYIHMVRKNSIYDYNIEVDSTDSLITLKTCTRFFGNSHKQQFQIDARKVRKNEKTYHYSIQKSSVYYELFENGEIIPSS